MPLLRAWVTSAVLLACALPGSAQKGLQPNILLIYVDDLGYGDLGCYGHPIIKTPNLDRLADEGSILTNYYAPSALCSPSRAALLTGRHPYRSGIESWIPDHSGVYLHEQEKTLAELLADAGYRTGLVGKWHLNSDLGATSEAQPRDHGFMYSYGHNAFQIPTNYRPTNIYRNGEKLDVQDGYTAELYVDEAIDWIDDKQGDEPFFLYLSMAEPHTTIENPANYNAIYEDYTEGPVVPIPSGGEKIPYGKLVPRGPGEYYANITYLDHQLGRVFKHLDESKLRDNTIVIFASDNGPVTSAWRAWWEVNAYGNTNGLRGRKHYLYEGGIKVPAIVRHPGFSELGAIDEVVVGTDLFATILAWCQVAVPQDRAIDGLDMSPVFKGDTLPTRDLIWSLPTDNGLDHAIRSGDWKLLLDGNGVGQELYDLGNDPLELVNLIGTDLDLADQMEYRWKQKFDQIMLDPLRP